MKKQNSKRKMISYLRFTMLLFMALAVSCANNTDLDEESQVEENLDLAAKITNGQTISLKANNNKYVSSENGTKDMIANRSAIGSYEKFTVVKVGTKNGNDLIALKANNNKYVCSEDGTKDMIANRTAIGAWEKFEVIQLGTASGNELIALRASNNKYVCSENGTKDMRANRTAIGAYEKFQVINNGGSTSTVGSFTFSNIQIETTKSCTSSTSTVSKNATDTNNTNGGTNDSYFIGKYQKNSNGSYKLTSCKQSGRRTEWKQKPGQEASLNTTRTMSYTASFSDYPSDGITIAQVHNRGDAERPLLRVEIKNGKIRCYITTTYKKNQGSTYETTLQSYTSGADLDIKVEIGNNRVKITAKTGSVTKTATYTTNNSNIKKVINNKWFDNGVKDDFYFKAGVYNDSGDGSKTPDATFKSFVIN
ncbi:polysaccharide lyase family 7 protein [Kordia jejudonensis]|uniref:polysaccharide lyase family 7 protein n=1 Tax=Kordia jejudonensis TaxID=1348245 RepID=UPI00069A0464|nr:polysaccharide lyase family 7 protein [Kordia jejudonensis]